MLERRGREQVSDCGGVSAVGGFIEIHRVYVAGSRWHIGGIGNFRRLAKF